MCRPGWRSFLAIVSICAWIVIAGGCDRGSETSSGESESGAPSKAVLISAAASTRDAVGEIAREFQRMTGIEAKVNSGPSSGLASQILAGAPADLFLSANEKWAKAVSDAGLAKEMTLLVANELVLIVPKGNPARVSTPQDLTADRVVKVALAGEKVPAGMYADQALRSLALADPVATKIVRGHDVRVTLGYVERGEVEAGIVYATDAKISSAVETVAVFPPSSHDAIVYPLVLLRAAAGREAARRFFDVLRSTEARTVFERYGFRSVP